MLSDRLLRNKTKDLLEKPFVAGLTGFFSDFGKYCAAQTFVSQNKFFLFSFNSLTAFESLP
jgi:hypothetical protein